MQHAQSLLRNCQAKKPWTETSAHPIVITMLKNLRKWFDPWDHKPECYGRNTSCKPESRKEDKSLPSVEDLEKFETSYAGPQTGELLERYSGESLTVLCRPDLIFML